MNNLWIELLLCYEQVADGGKILEKTPLHTFDRVETFARVLPLPEVPREKLLTSILVYRLTRTLNIRDEINRINEPGFVIQNESGFIIREVAPLLSAWAVIRAVDENLARCHEK